MEYVPFEKPIAELETKIDQLRRTASSQAISLDDQVEELERKAFKLRNAMFSSISAYESVQISRHPRRPNTLELINYITSEFIELHGDRNFCDDKAIVGGLAKIDEQSVVILGHQKGRTTKENVERNFGMARPEGYRKALRLMSMAERFNLPIVTLVDTPGAYPGIGAEERGQSEAIGKNIMVMGRLKVPIISIIIGEGGSGGALGIAVANKVHMMKYSTYSVISPEGCASILMNDAGQASKVAESLKLTAAPAVEMGVVDGVIEEPLGGAHRGPRTTANNIKMQILNDLKELSELTGDQLREQRLSKFLSMGSVVEH